MQNFRDRLERLIAHLGISQTEMGKRLGVSRNMVSMLLRRDKEQKPSRAVTLLFEQEWESAFGHSEEETSQKLPPSGSFAQPLTLLQEHSPPYKTGAAASKEAAKALTGCDAVYELLHQASGPQELAFAISSFDRAWLRYKQMVQNTNLHSGLNQAESGLSACTTPSASSVVSGTLPRSLPANLATFPPHQFMTVEEAQARGIQIPEELLKQLQVLTLPDAQPTQTKRKL